MEICFSINYNFIIVIPGAWVKINIFFLTFFAPVSLKYFLKNATIYKNSNKEMAMFII